MTRSTSVMNAEGVDVAWISNTPITVKADGNCIVDIEITSARAPGIWNTRENTRVVCPDRVLPSQPDQQETLLASLVSTENNVNAKHFIVTQHADKYLRALNAKDQAYTDKLVEKTKLFCTTLDKDTEFKSMPSDYKLGIVDNTDKTQCSDLSQFQREMLPWFRKLPDNDNLKKTVDRYSLEAFNTRVTSPEIKVFAVKKEGKLLGTLTLNLHTTADASESARFGYLSDLFVAKGLDNADFINQFISRVFAEIAKNFTSVEVLAGMTASNDVTIPIVQCFKYAEEAGLTRPFTRSEQERLGVVAHFTMDPKNDGKTHFPPLTPGTLTKLSLLTEMQRQSSLDKEQALMSAPQSKTLAPAPNIR